MENEHYKNQSFLNFVIVVLCILVLSFCFLAKKCKAQIGGTQEYVCHNDKLFDNTEVYADYILATTKDNIYFFHFQPNIHYSERFALSEDVCVAITAFVKNYDELLCLLDSYHNDSFGSSLSFFKNNDLIICYIYGSNYQINREDFYIPITKRKKELYVDSR